MRSENVNMYLYVLQDYGQGSHDDVIMKWLNYDIKTSALSEWGINRVIVSHNNTYNFQIPKYHDIVKLWYILRWLSYSYNPSSHNISKTELPKVAAIQQP